MQTKPVVSARVEPQTLEQIEAYAGDRDRSEAVTELLEVGLAFCKAAPAEGGGASDA